MTDFRIFVEKYAEFNVEAKQLLADLKLNLHLSNLESIRVINIYDIFNIQREELERSRYVVFAEAPVDQVYETIDLPHQNWFAVEPLPGQYDQRADSALQALNLLAINHPQLSLTTAKLIILDGNLNVEDFERIKDYYINPLEVREKDLTTLNLDTPHETNSLVPQFTGFNSLSKIELTEFRLKHGLAMTLEDIEVVQEYFKNQCKRDPSETEIKVLDTYWSDHCRHTTFETQITDIEFLPGKYQQVFQNVFEQYCQSRQKVHGAKLNNKPITLMDLATICGKEYRHEGILNDVEISDEINACSILVDIEIDGQHEKWSLQFKNETHNHPTEIEPYGGASTCVGGAIRDPLSGRSYVYQAMRISGAANPLEKVEDTLVGKLPQRKITTKAAHGFSSYGNQIGLATTHVKEIYHPGYKAKRMEVGMVVAASPYANIRREKPASGDKIILLGGRTGRDGCGGATGSSKEHDVNSASQCGAEVQKGNPIVERKIQRLFRNPEVTKLIKKCNDFGAGGVSVAIGELADGVLINLDLVPTKYHGLTGTELAISESQERMAVVVASTDANKFIDYAIAENLEANIVAEVTAEARMIMLWRGNEIVNLERSFLDTNGAKSYSKAKLTTEAQKELFTSHYLTSNFKENLKANLADLNNCSQQGMVDMFDATIGATTVLMPYGGKYKLTPTQVSVQKFPVINGITDNASIASFGFNPYLSTSSPFHGAYYAVIESVAKIVAAGADYSNIKFSFQEYFEKLGSDPLKWGKPFAALLGAYAAQQGLKLAAIGGKDSMSGTFNDLHVPPTLISFAVAPTLASQIISPEFKDSGNYIYTYVPKYDENDLINFNSLNQEYQVIHKLILDGTINAAMAIGNGGIADAICKMSFGNKIGCYLKNEIKINLFSHFYGGIVFTTNKTLTEAAFIPLGQTTSEAKINACGESINIDELIEVWQATLAPVFPVSCDIESNDKPILEVKSHNLFIKQKAEIKVARPRVIIPAFPGTNCEYDSLKAFNNAGAIAKNIVFNNLSIRHIEDSINILAEEINNSQILMLPGGFSAGDEPDGSAKFIATILKNGKIRDAVHDLLDRDGLILGICNGFQALVKSGLLPYGQIRDLNSDSPTLTYNVVGRHISRITATKVVNNSSPWLNSFSLGEIKQVAMSHGEGRFVVNKDLAQELIINGQIACQYVDLDGNPSYNGIYNPNGSDYAIEAITSADGRILGKMGHSERKGSNLYKNIVGDKHQDIFANGVNYFK